MPDLIFKSRVDLKKEYQFLVKELIPKLNDCGYCGVLKGKYCLKFSINCQICLKYRFQTCFQFNRTKDLLINNTDKEISNYVKKFLIDYFSVSDFTNYFFNLNLKEDVKDKDPIKIDLLPENKINPTVKKEKTNEKIFCNKSKKYRHYFYL